MKIVTWNINGLRATKQSFKQLLEFTDADILCLQETKITKDLLTSDIALVDGYSSYFSFSQKRSGYSGVATFCKNLFSPVKAQAGLSSLHEVDAGNDIIGCYGNLENMFESKRLKELDLEGRAIITQHQLKGGKEQLLIINVYCPRADLDDVERYEYKVDFYKALEERAKSFLHKGNYVIIVGDFNVSHKAIDHCDPSDPVSFLDNKSRAWLDGFIFNDGDYSTVSNKLKKDRSVDVKSGCFVDTFRYFYPTKSDIYTCWCTSSRARETNYGTRIDYVFCDRYLANLLKSCEILTDFLGSDHCPVETLVDIDIVPSKHLPKLCTSFYTTFGGKQLKMSSYFNSTVKRSASDFDKSSKETPVPNKKVAKTSQMKLTGLFSKHKESVHAKAPPCNKSNTVNVKIKPSSSKSTVNTDASLFWKSLLKGPEPPPLCSSHNEPCVKRTVKKEGPNLGRQFYCCSRPEGHKSNPEARCQFFKWC